MIRTIEDKDIKECLDIYNYYILNTVYTFEEKALTLEEFSIRVNKIKEKFPYIVYENDNKEVIGYAYLNYFNERSAYRRSADLSIYVSCNHLKEHIGYKLLEKIERLAKDNGIDTIISIVTDENINSKNFHEKNGFIVEGHLHDVAFKHSRSLGIYYLRKYIG